MGMNGHEENSFQKYYVPVRDVRSGGGAGNDNERDRSPRYGISGSDRMEAGSEVHSKNHTRQKE